MLYSGELTLQVRRHGRMDSTFAPHARVSWFAHQPGQLELTPRIHYVQVTSSAGDGASTLALKPMARVNRSLKQRAAVAPQNGDLSSQKIIKKTHSLTNYKLCEANGKFVNTFQTVIS